MLQLSVVEARVLGALMEKEVTTPEYYPLSLNALVAACNQKSSREPVMQVSERDVETALRSLDGMELVRADHGSRVERYENRARTVFQLRRDEHALLCLLLLRGPQTPGELRGRAERLFEFEDTAQVLSALQRLSTAAESNTAYADPSAVNRREPLVRMLPRQPGAREARYAQTLSDSAAYLVEEAQAQPASSPSASTGRIEALEATVSALSERVRRMEQALGLAESEAE